MNPLHISLSGVLLSICLFAATRSPAQMHAEGIHLHPWTLMTQRTFGPSGRFSDSVFTPLGQWAWGPCMAAAAHEEYVFIGNGPTFQALDATNPSTPVLLGEYLAPGPVRDIVIRNDTAIVIAANMLILLDVGDPHQIRKISELAFPGLILRLAVEGNLVYVTAFGGSVSCVDIQDPSNPVRRGFIVTPTDFPAGVAVKDRRAYVGNVEMPFLAVIDARQPDSLRSSFMQTPGRPGSVCIRDTLLFLSVAGFDGYQTLKVFSIVDPSFPVEVGSVPVGFSTNYLINSITVDGNYVFAGIDGHGIDAVDISDPTHPRIADSLFTNALAYDPGYSITSSRGIIYAGCIAGLWILQGSRPDSLLELAFFKTSDLSNKVVTRGNLAFIASGLAGMWIIDFSNPSNPRGVSSVLLGGFARDVILDGNYAYVSQSNTYGIADSLQGVWTVDISNPLAPRTLSSIHIRSPLSLTKVDNHLLVSREWSASNDTVFDVLDATIPDHLQRLGVLQGHYHVLGMAAVPGTAYLACPESGLVIVDYRNPSSPLIASKLFGFTVGVAVQDTFVYVDRAASFLVMSISNPLTPRTLGAMSRNYGNYSVIKLFPYGRFVFWSGGNLLGVVDVTEPTNPLDTYHFDAASSTSVAAESNLVLYTMNVLGLAVLRNDLLSSVSPTGQFWPARYELSQNYPNPFNPSTTIEFSVPRSERVAIEVFDVLGRKVCTALDTRVQSGHHRIRFDSSGLSSGIYFYQLSTSSYATTKRMILIR